MTLSSQHPTSGLPATHPFSENQLTASAWFSELQTTLCRAFESIEDTFCDDKASRALLGVASPPTPGRFVKESWQHEQGGGGTMAVMNGVVFEKIGVNVSTVYGRFPEQFCREIPGADSDPSFWASGISLVAHPRNPFVPAVHMNTRHIITTKSWFGGGADLTPIYPDTQDTQDFHAAFKGACDRHDPSYYPKFKDWCDTYFYLPHRQEPRGVGGIFYDYVNTGNWAADFAFTQDVGRTFAAIYPAIVQRHMLTPWTQQHRDYQLLRRGRYIEFNLLYDRGTRFGLQTGGRTEAILMSLPPVAHFPPELQSV